RRVRVRARALHWRSRSRRCDMRGSPVTRLLVGILPHVSAAILLFSCGARSSVVGSDERSTVLEASPTPDDREQVLDTLPQEAPPHGRGSDGDEPRGASMQPTEATSPAGCNGLPAGASLIARAVASLQSPECAAEAPPM